MTHIFTNYGNYIKSNIPGIKKHFTCRISDESPLDQYCKLNHDDLVKANAIELAMLQGNPDVLTHKNVKFIRMITHKNGTRIFNKINTCDIIDFCDTSNECFETIKEAFDNTGDSSFKIDTMKLFTGFTKMNISSFKNLMNDRFARCFLFRPKSHFAVSSYLPCLIEMSQNIKHMAECLIRYLNEEYFRLTTADYLEIVKCLKLKKFARQTLSLINRSQNRILRSYTGAKAPIRMDELKILASISDDENITDEYNRKYIFPNFVRSNYVYRQPSNHPNSHPIDYRTNFGFLSDVKISNDSNYKSKTVLPRWFLNSTNLNKTIGDNAIKAVDLSDVTINL